MASAMPEWTPPPAPTEQVKAALPKLSVYNSLTRTKTPFVPLDPEGKKVTWYACGPTVYDDAHLGHARNYVSTDIIRRILNDYFKFRVNFVMNITDVDDKIILAARQQYFLKQFIAQHPTIDEDVLSTTKAAFVAYTKKTLPLIPEDVRPDVFAQEVEKAYGHVLKGQALEKDGSVPGDKEAKVKMHLKTATTAAEALSDSGAEREAFFAKSSGVLLPYLDSQYKESLDTSDQSIFTALTKKFEDRFFSDVGALNVQPPDTITRVTEYGPQIVEFVKQIQDNGFAYEHEGSVYYDTQAWETSGGVYARLEPWNRNDKDLQADGEGALSNTKTSFKKSAADFALWKASKSGEPYWPSPWGPGRPGWHIECSAMASDVLGRQFDIHSGGIDLAFPHHDNELAQSEAYWAKSGKESKQWVNYFLHMGHLSIQGSKMSKSLKNFTTIREALSRGDWTPRGLRIAFLLGAWKDGLEITDEVVKAGTAWEERVNNFFIKARDVESNPSPNTANGNADPAANPDGTVKEALASAKFRLHDALCDSFDTPAAMRVISDLITSYNSEKGVSNEVTLAVSAWLTEIVNVFGLDATPEKGRTGWSGIDIPEAAKPYVYPIATLRDEVRRQAIAGSIDAPLLSSKLVKPTSSSSPESAPYEAAWTDFSSRLHKLIAENAAPKAYLALCDFVRDTTLWDLAIYLEDREAPLPALVRPLTGSLRAERSSREALAALKLQKAAAAKEAKDKEERERLEKGKLSHLEMFRTSEYSAWDEEGLPTKDKEGVEVAKSRSKKLRKEWERQKKLHEAWLASLKSA